jgi:hypothetical protein
MTLNSIKYLNIVKYIYIYIYIYILNIVSIYGIKQNKMKHETNLSESDAMVPDMDRRRSKKSYL